MNENTNDFLLKFQNLPGETIKEKQNNFYKLLNENRNLLKNPQQLEVIEANLKPKNHFEKILRTDFLIYFHCFDALYKDFQKGDEITTKKLAKQEWFYETAYKQIDCKNFVNVILPQTSHSLKLKILKRIPLTEEKADELFDAIKAKYGVYLASNLTTKCSSRKIENIIKTFPVKLTVSQQKKIFDKNANLIDLYFEERLKIEENKKFINSNSILIYIAQKNPEKFTQLFKKYKFKTNLGRRTTKQFIKNQKDKVLQDGKYYLQILNKQTCVRKIGFQLKTILFETDPECCYDKIWMNIIDFYPKNHRFEIYQTGYDEFYCKKFGEDVTDLQDKEFELIQNLDLREKLAVLKRQQEPSDALMKFLKPETCFQEVLDKLSTSETDTRINLIAFLTENCILNKDYSVLLKTCNLVAVRFKYHDYCIRERFLNILVEHTEILEHLEDSHWKYITKILAVSEIQKAWIQQKHKLYFYYLVFLLRNGQDITEFLKKRPEDYVDLLECNIVKYRKEYKEILTKMLTLGLPKSDSDNTTTAECDLNLIYYCKIFNKQNPKEAIDYRKYPRILQSLQIIFDNESEYYGCQIGEGIEYLLFQKSANLELIEYKHLYFKKLAAFDRVKSLVWFLKHDPHILEANLEVFLTKYYKLNKKTFWKLIQKNSFMGLDQKVVDFYKQKIEEDVTYKASLIKKIAILAEPNWLLDFIKNYIPQKDKVDLHDETSKNLYEFQASLVRYLHLTNNDRVDVINATFDFCKGDYLKFALQPLYSSIYKLPENETETFIERLKRVPAIAVQKHYVHLSLVIYDSNKIKSCLKTSNLQLLLPAIKYFVKTPSDELWEYIKKEIETSRKNEVQILKQALRIKFPQAYKAKFIETVWKVMEKHDEKLLQETLFSTINQVNFSLDFANTFIKSNIFKNDGANDAICKTFLDLQSDDKYQLMDEILQTWKVNYWNCEKRSMHRQCFYQFFVDLFNVYMKAKSPQVDFPIKLLEVFQKNFSVTEMFHEFIIVKSLVLKNQNLETSARFLLDLNASLVDKFGEFCTSLLATTLSFVFDQIFKIDEKKLELLFEFFKLSNSRQDSLLLLKLLPNKQPQDKKHFGILYKEILEKLENTEDKLVQLQLNCYLKQQEPVCFYCCCRLLNKLH